MKVIFILTILLSGCASTISKIDEKTIEFCEAREKCEVICVDRGGVNLALPFTGCKCNDK